MIRKVIVVALAVLLSPVAAHNIGEEVGLPGRVEGWIARAKEQVATEAE